MEFNLALDKYSVADLRSMFKLGDVYEACDVDEKAQAIRSQLVTEAMNPKVIADLTQFIGGAKDILLQNVRDDLIPRPPIPYISAKKEEYVPGLVNPYERRQMTKCVSIDTLFRYNYENTESTDFSYMFPETVKNAVSMQLSSIELPNIINTFSKKNQSNSFQITVRNLGTELETITSTIYVPDGTYMSDVFETVMNNVLASNGFPYLMIDTTIQTRTELKARDVSDGISVYDPLSEYYSPSFELDVDFSVYGRDFNTTAGWNMGFRKTAYTASAQTNYETGITYNHCIVSESSFGSTIDNYLFLEIDDFQNNFQTDTIISATSQSYLGKNILARVVLTSGFSNVVQNVPADGIFKLREYFGPVRLERLHVRLLNKFGDVVDLNRNDFSFVLEFKTIYS